MPTDIVKKFESAEFGALRVVKDEGGEPWFVARDVCAALGLSNVGQAIIGLDRDEKNSISIDDGNRGNPKKAIVSEAGLYSLIMRSRKPEAKAFKRWVTHEVLPSIRKDGGYMVAREDESDEQVMARALLIADKALKARDARIAELEPKARFADAVAASDGTCLVGELAKMLRQNGVDVGQNRLFAKLRDDGFLGKVGQNRNVPTQRAMDMGLFRIKETAVTHSDGHTTITRTPKVTGKGQTYFMARYAGGIA
jgi:anti-repressor protein